MGKRSTRGESPEVLQVKVVLRGFDPPVWRRVALSVNASFAQLHEVLQQAMGWQDCHLHEFRVGAVICGLPDPDGPPGLLDERQQGLSPHFAQGTSGLYLYDFGDGWEHELLVERVEPADPAVAYPICTAGARACPPEDCGGAVGYQELLEALADPRHPAHETMKTWVGGDFDPEGFDRNMVNRRLQRRRLSGSS